MIIASKLSGTFAACSGNAPLDNDPTWPLAIFAARCGTTASKRLLCIIPLKNNQLSCTLGRLKYTQQKVQVLVLITRPPTKNKELLAAHRKKFIIRLSVALSRYIHSGAIFLFDRASAGARSSFTAHNYMRDTWKVSFNGNPRRKTIKPRKQTHTQLKAQHKMYDTLTLTVARRAARASVNAIMSRCSIAAAGSRRTLGAKMQPVFSTHAYIRTHTPRPMQIH